MAFPSSSSDKSSAEAGSEEKPKNDGYSIPGTSNSGSLASPLMARLDDWVPRRSWLRSARLLVQFSHALMGGRWQVAHELETDYIV